MPDTTEELELRVSLVELRAWLRASKNLAVKEGFHRLARSLGETEDEFDAWLAAGHHTVKVSAE